MSVMSPEATIRASWLSSAARMTSIFTPVAALKASGMAPSQVS